MKLLLFSFGICVALLGIGTRAEAQNYPWCAIYGGYDDGGTNSGFTMHGHREGYGQLVPT